MGAGGRVGGELVEGERVRAAGGGGVGRWLLGVRERGQRGGERREGARGEGVAGADAGQGGRVVRVLCGAGRAGGAAAGEGVEECAFTAAAE